MQGRIRLTSAGAGRDLVETQRLLREAAAMVHAKTHARISSTSPPVCNSNLRASMCDTARLQTSYCQLDVRVRVRELRLRARDRVRSRVRIRGRERGDIGDRVRARPLPRDLRCTRCPRPYANAGSIRGYPSARKRLRDSAEGILICGRS